MISGILNLQKPPGMTSHDVVNKVRQVTGIRKVGHAGALDPMATGVLLICVGKATRVAEYLMRSDKGYGATVRLGIETDTYDADGRVLHAGTVSVERHAVEAVLRGFCGVIAQVPPMYSAIKQGGQPLHRLARRGITVEREPRRAVISHIALTDWAPPKFSFEVTCSAGTYVRSLAHDLGQQLGCGAHLTRLERTQSGKFMLGDAAPLDLLTPETWRNYLHPMEVAVADMPRVDLDPQAVIDLSQGRCTPRLPAHPPAELARAHDNRGAFFALIKPSPDQTEWLPHKVLSPDS